MLLQSENEKVVRNTKPESAAESSREAWQLEVEFELALGEALSWESRHCTTEKFHEALFTLKRVLGCESSEWEVKVDASVYTYTTVLQELSELVKTGRQLRVRKFLKLVTGLITWAGEGIFGECN